MLGLVALFVIIISSCFYFFIKQPKNIFDEIYQETERTYLGNNVFNQLKHVEVHKYQEYSDDSKFYPSIAYEKISVDFNFKFEAQLSLISFEKRIESNVSIKMWTVYSHKERSLKNCKNSFEEGRYEKLHRRRSSGKILPRAVWYHCQGLGFLLRRNRQPESLKRLVFDL